MTQKATIAKAQVFSNSLRDALMLNLVAEYKLDGNAVDSWGGHSTGVITATPSSDCIQGTCYSFNGTNGDNINIPYDADTRPTGKITVGVWGSMVNWTASDARILSCTESGGYNFNIGTSSANVMLNIGGTYQSPFFYSTSPQTGWHYFLFTYDGRYFKVYFDGIYKSQYDAGTTTPIVYNFNNNLTIGEEAGSGAPAGTNYFTGKIDEIRIFKEAIPNSQIKEQYYAGLNRLLANGGITGEEYMERSFVLGLGN
jgi:hypothetical protein